MSIYKFLTVAIKGINNAILCHCSAPERRISIKSISPHQETDKISRTRSWPINFRHFPRIASSITVILSQAGSSSVSSFWIWRSFSSSISGPFSTIDFFRKTFSKIFTAVCSNSTLYFLHRLFFSEPFVVLFLRFEQMRAATRAKTIGFSSEYFQKYSASSKFWDKSAHKKYWSIGGWSVISSAFDSPSLVRFVIFGKIIVHFGVSN